MKKIKKAETLMDEGRECLDCCDYKGAREIGKTLLKLKYSGGYELIAESYYQKGRLKKAIKIVEKGLEAASEVWFLWHLHAVYNADAGNFEKAHKSISRAISCNGCDIAFMKYQQSRAYSQEGRNDEAIISCENILKEIDDKNPLKSEVITHLMSLLNERNELDKSINIGVSHLEAFQEDDYSEDEADVLSRIAYAYFLKGERSFAEGYVRKALGIVHCHEYSLFALREINDSKSKNTKHFSILVNGKLERENELCFFKAYDVVAENKDEAIEFIKYVLSAYKGKILKIDKLKIIEDSPNEYKGVYSSPGFTFYDSNLKKQKH